MMCIPVSIGYFFVSDLIGLMSHDEAVIHFSEQFAHYAVLFLWTNAMCSGIRQFHQSLEITVPFTAISMIAIVLNIIGNQLWISGLNVSIFGFVISFEGLG